MCEVSERGGFVVKVDGCVGWDSCMGSGGVRTSRALFGLYIHIKDYKNFLKFIFFSRDWHHFFLKSEKTIEVIFCKMERCVQGKLWCSLS